MFEGVVVRVYDRGHLIDVADAYGTRPAVKGVRVTVSMMDPLTGKGESRMLSPGTRVIVAEMEGGPVCLGVLPVSVSEVNDLSGEVTGIKDPAPEGTQGTPNFNSAREKDTIPGDWILSNGEALLGLLLGGLSILKVSPLAQIILDRKDDLLRIISRQVQWFTDSGILDLQTDDSTGRTSIRLRLGTDVSKSRSPGDNWDLIFDFGVDEDRPLVCRFRDQWICEIDSKNNLFFGGASISVPGIDDLVASVKSITASIAKGIHVTADTAELVARSSISVSSPGINVTGETGEASFNKVNVNVVDDTSIKSAQGMNLESLFKDLDVKVSKTGSLNLSSGMFKGDVSVTSTAGRFKVNTFYKPGSISLGGDVFAPILDIPLTMLFTTMFTMMDLMTADLSTVQAAVGLVTPATPPASAKYLWLATLGPMLATLRSNMVRIGA